MSWLMILGAGAPRPAPTRDAILRELGWRKSGDAYVHPEAVGGRMLPVLRSAQLTARAAPPKVVFGTLHRFGIPFAPQVEGALRGWRPRPNAVHGVAAAALARGWPVWTPNVDLQIERAHEDLTGTPMAVVCPWTSTPWTPRSC